MLSYIHNLIKAKGELMKNIIKNSALTALIAISSINSSLAEEIKSMESAKTIETLYSQGNVLNGHEVGKASYIEPLLLDAETMQYRNLTDFYDNPRPILAHYKEDVGYPEQVDLNITDETDRLVDTFMENEANNSLSRDDLKNFMVLKEVAKHFCIMYETGQEMLEIAGSYDDMEPYDKGILHKNETIVNATALVLFAKSELNDNPIKGTEKIKTLTFLLGQLENEHSSSAEALKEVGIELSLAYIGDKGLPNNSLQEANARRITNIVSKNYKDVGKQYYAKLVAEEKANPEYVATLTF